MKCSGCNKKITGTMYLNSKGYQCSRCGNKTTKERIKKYFNQKTDEKKKALRPSEKRFKKLQQEVSLDKHKEITICYLKEWFGLCKPPYEPDCLGCMAARIVEALK